MRSRKTATVTHPIDKAPASWSHHDKVFWAQTYVDALTYTRRVPEYYEEDAKLTADVVARTRRQGCSPLRALPYPGDMTELGIFQGVDYVDRDGHIWTEQYTFTDRKILMWSRSLRALIVVPGMKVSSCDQPPVPEDSRVLRTWTGGRRGGRCSMRPHIRPTPLPRCFPGVAVSYWSDKFNKQGEMVNYIHHFDSVGVKVWLGPGSPPQAFFVQGGKLRIETHGISG
jgi:hypothetical protein